jgi:hypothetical protein
MADTKDFESLDELFRKTFDNLPDTPAKSGWDTPSERVWQHVQAQIKPPKSGWSVQTITLLAAFAVVLTVGLYLLLNRPAVTETPAPTPPPVAETTGQQPVGIQEQIAEKQPATIEKTSSPAKILKKKQATNLPATTSETPLKEEIEAAKAAQTDSSAEKPAKPSGKKPPSPNTTERLKAELAQRAEEAWKMPLQTLPQRWPGKSN